MKTKIPRRGFTIVELLVLFVIIGILVVLLISTGRKARETRAREEARQQSSRIQDSSRDTQSPARQIVEIDRALGKPAPSEAEIDHALDALAARFGEEKAMVVLALQSVHDGLREHDVDIGAKEFLDIVENGSRDSGSGVGTLIETMAYYGSSILADKHGTRATSMEVPAKLAARLRKEDAKIRPLAEAVAERFKEDDETVIKIVAQYYWRARKRGHATELYDFFAAVELHSRNPSATVKTVSDAASVASMSFSDVKHVRNMLNSVRAIGSDQWQQDFTAGMMALKWAILRQEKAFEALEQDDFDDALSLSVEAEAFLAELEEQFERIRSQNVVIQDDDRRVRARCLLTAGLALREMGKRQEAIDSLERALALCDAPAKGKFDQHRHMFVRSIQRVLRDLREDE